MDYGQFIALIRDLRDAQTTYFRTRTPRALARARELERTVDRLLAANPSQPALFEIGEDELERVE